MSLPYIFIVGCTGSGKTALSVALAKKLNTDIISCDSMQIYRGMDIGTAKATAVERGGVTHHMLDIVDIDEVYSVSNYLRDVNFLLDNSCRPSLFVGGTGLYVNALIYGFSFSGATSDSRLRSELVSEYNEFGADYLHNKLKRIDPVAASEIHPNNYIRVIRAIEIFEQTGVKKSENVDSGVKNPKPHLAYAINYERDVLYERINKRVDIMIESGLVDEVRRIVDMGYDRNLQALRAIGYKEIIDYIYGEISLSDAAEKIKQNTRHYAKRQLTWFKRMERLVWMPPEMGQDEMIARITHDYTTFK